MHDFCYKSLMTRTVCPMNGLYLCRFGIRKFPKKLVIYLLCRKLIVEKSITYNMYMVAITTEKVKEKTLIYQDLSSFFSLYKTIASIRICKRLQLELDK